MALIILLHNEKIKALNNEYVQKFQKHWNDDKMLFHDADKRKHIMMYRQFSQIENENHDWLITTIRMYNEPRLAYNILRRKNDKIVAKLPKSY